MPLLGVPLIKFATIPSTQDWARGWAELGAAEGLVVWALSQSEGRGRGERKWWSPPAGGLYLSLLLRPAIALTQASEMTMLTALAACDTCTALAGIRPRPKWPNDLLYHGRKLAGILSEQSVQGERLRYVIVGLGLNINTDFSHTPLAATATSLKAETGQSYDLERACALFLQALDRRYQQWRDEGISPFLAWRRQLEPIGRRVRVRRSGQPDLVGRAIEATPQGALLVRDEEGQVHTIWAGDVIPLAKPTTGQADTATAPQK
ncbi:MAG: biotin--[acetyl-CoA-carboxylase] ligase [Chloroflexi bacterium]|nr:biotin--[acetyl-CoA-carboxylase] ligase [Chloroflexota bacterium]